MQNADETRINRLVWCERERDDVVDVWTVRVLAAEVVGDGSAAVGARQISRAGPRPRHADESAATPAYDEGQSRNVRFFLGLSP